MTRRSSDRLARLACLAAAAGGACASNFSVGYDGESHNMLDLGVFGYEPGGMLHISVRQLVLRSEPQGWSCGFVLDWVPTPQAARARARRRLPSDVCYLDSPEWAPRAPPGITPPQVTRKALDLGDWRGTATASLPPLSLDYEVPEAGLYALVFYTCPPQRARHPRMRLSARVSQYNIVDDKTRERDYLSSGDAELPFMYMGFAVVYGYVAVVWFREMRSQAQHVRKVHQLMAVVVSVKTLSMVFEAAKWHSQQTYGEATAWDVMHFVFLTLRGLLLCMGILLIGSGWSTLKPVLSRPDWAVIAVVVPVQVAANIIVAVVDETHSLTQKGAWAWGAWRDALRTLDMVCCVAVLLPTAWLIRQLQKRGATEGKAGRNLILLRKFQNFYFAVAAYLYAPRAFAILVAEGLDPIYAWSVPFAHEAAGVLFYLFCGMQFQPQAPTPLPRDDDDSPAEGDDEDDGSGSGAGRLLLLVPLVPLPLLLLLLPMRQLVLAAVVVAVAFPLLRFALRDHLSGDDDDDKAREPAQV